ncbi:helix-turn-helix domain-containing protein [Aliivibrio logei]|uniref:OmpR/PhoB-type domain-containing protein n=1 Tax=Aliivibrio logei 5S-186 TaxID=626086 RepID=A0ABX3B002_ALILO|nr:helix-turn-helix domain-containing protein [Aliivibrio logei]OEF22521.1 hypothetical protein A1Q5_15710 [Aliivibrio logei 5S-186]
MEIKLYQSALFIEFNDIKNTSNLKINLTRSEFFILRKLFEVKGKHLTKETLKTVGWPDSYVCDNSLTMSIMTLRKKLAAYSDVIRIKTIQRVGYSLYYTTDELMIKVIQ